MKVIKTKAYKLNKEVEDAVLGVKDGLIQKAYGTFGYIMVFILFYYIYLIYKTLY